MNTSTPRDPQPFEALDPQHAQPATVRLLPADFCRERWVVCYGPAPEDPLEPLRVACLDPDDAALREDLERRLDRPVQLVRAEPGAIERVLEVGYGEVEVDEDAWRLTSVKAIGLEPGGHPAAILDQVLGHALWLGASDVHLEQFEHGVQVRMRIEGVMRRIATPFDAEGLTRAVHRLRVLAGDTLTHGRVGHEGHLEALYVGKTTRPVHLRLSTLPGPFGEEAVIRVLDAGRRPFALDELGMSGAMRAQLEALLSPRPEGLLLVSGPTGAGKTTTLYALVRRLAGVERKILTVEDPIEFVLDGVNQKQTSDQLGFADYARAILRQSPDVLLIGEIRDPATAEVALQAGHTGHLVLSTIHASGSAQALNRLHLLGASPWAIASGVVASLAQRLVRRACAECVAETEGEAAWLASVGVAPDAGPFGRAVGCPACHDTGYRGRTGVFELLPIDAAVAEGIEQGESARAIRRRALEAGLPTLHTDGLEKARAKHTTLDELRRVLPRVRAGGAHEA